MMDIVIPFRKQSPASEEMLRYALRSIEKNLEGCRTVFLLADEEPKWIKEKETAVVFVADRNVSPDRNIYEKITTACGITEASDPFLVWHDDHFLLEKTEARLIDFYFNKTINQKLDEFQLPEDYSFYFRTLMNSGIALERKELPTKFFDIHAPMQFLKRGFLDVMRQFDWEHTYEGFCVKSLYANTLRIDGVEMSDLKFSEPVSVTEIRKKVSSRMFFSISAKAWDQTMVEFLKSVFPDKSKFEN